MALALTKLILEVEIDLDLRYQIWSEWAEISQKILGECNSPNC